MTEEYFQSFLAETTDAARRQKIQKIYEALKRKSDPVDTNDFHAELIRQGLECA
jgi:hypothetical protein